MKKLILINAIVFTMMGCGGGKDKGENPPPKSSSVASSVSSSLVSSIATSSSTLSVSSSAISLSSSSSSVSSVANTSSSAPSSDSSSSSSASNWELVWSDEFNGSTIDSAKWSFEKNCAGGGNNELQCYTDRPANASVSDGK
ncbi:MAG: hypothetical protein ABW044_02325, partial [Cellvibrio sp.]